MTLHHRDAFLDTPDEDKVVDSGDEDTSGLSVTVLPLPGHGKEVLDFMLGEEVADLNSAFAVAMGNAHGEPLFEVVGNTFIKNIIGGHRANDVRRGNRRF